MLNPREIDMLSLFIYFIMLPLVTYFLLGIWNENAQRKERIDLIAQQVAEESDRTDDISVVESTVIPLVHPPNDCVRFCAKCFGPASTRCAHCKSVRYCSGRCQIAHWRLVHKYECRMLGNDYHGNVSSSETGNSLSQEQNIQETPLSSSAAPDMDFITSTNSLSDKKSLDDGTVHEAKSVTGDYTTSNSLDCPTLPQLEKNAHIREGEVLITEHNADAPCGAEIEKSNSPSGSISLETIEKTDESRVANLSTIRTKDKKKLAEEDHAEHSEHGSSRQRKLKMIFPYEEFIKCFQMEISNASLSPRGLVNCGNSCYANAVLQCLTLTKPLTVYLLRRSHSRAGCSKNRCLMCELERLVMFLRKGGGPLSPANILTHIRSLNSQIGDGSQEDAHEFLRLLVASMQTISLETFGGEKRVDPKHQDTTFIQHMFGGHLQSKVKCLNCNHESLRCENMMDLTLEILDHVQSLEDALAQFTSPEYLDGENMYQCLRCAAYVRAQKQLKIQDAPNILTIVLKRFQEGNYGKNNKYITFPEWLNMVPYMTGTEDVPPLYMLYGVIVHLDTSNASLSGHYVAYIKDMQDNWFKVDDSEVKPVKLSHVMSQGAYILFYMRSYPRVLTSSKSTRHQTVNQKSSPRIQILSRPEQTNPNSSNIEKQPNIHTRLATNIEYDTSISRQTLIRENRSSRPSICKNYAELSGHTSSDWSHFTSTDDSSFTTESARDSFCTVESMEVPFCSVYRSLYHNESASCRTISCSIFPGILTTFAREELGVVYSMEALVSSNEHDRHVRARCVGDMNWFWE